MRVKIVLLISLFSTNIGEWIYFIALNLKVLKLTDSAMAVSFLYMLMPIALLLTSGWAGSVIDRVPIRKLFIILNLICAVLIFCIANTSNIFLIYFTSLVLHMGNSIYSTASFVYITRIVPDGEQQRFNGWKSMAQSSGFIIGPSIAGALFIVGSVQFAIIINTVILLISSGLYLFLPKVKGLMASDSISFRMLREDWQAVLQYSKRYRFVAAVLILFGMYTVGITAIDSLEAAFAMTILHLDESTYGLLVSMAGIGFVVGSIINIKWSINPLSAMKWGMIFSAIGYVIFSLPHTWAIAAVGFILLSAALTFVNVGYTTYIQKNVSNDLLGRFISVFSMVEALSMLLLIAFFGMLTEIVHLRILLVSGVLILLIIVSVLVGLEKYSRSSSRIFG